MATTRAPAVAPVVSGAAAGHDDPAGRARLGRMKAMATGLLGVAGLIFLITFTLPNSGPNGYLRAAAEAGMIGGLADWFAVTALFRHPLGLRIPHEADDTRLALQLLARPSDTLAAG